MSTADIFSRARGTVLAALAEIAPGLPEAVAARVEASPGRDPAQGEIATNAAMLAAKPAGQKPAALAAALAARLAGRDGIARAEAAGPGFVNLWLEPGAWRAVLPEVLRAGAAYGDGASAPGLVNVEYVSANPTGPLHVGHCRGAVVGDALANLLAKSGRLVLKEFYVNDAGAQVDALAWAAYWRYLAALGSTTAEADIAALAPGGLQYRGDYLVPVGEALAAAEGARLAGPDLAPADTSLWLDPVRAFAVAAMLAAIRDDLAALGIAQDVFTSERSLLHAGAAERAIERLRAGGHVYEGTLEPPRGKTPDDWEKREQTLFRATALGDEVDRPLRKSDGSNTYFANDIAYHADKAARGATELIDVLGADHGGYVARMRAALRALAPETGFAVVLCQIVHVVRDGQPVRMSKRAGTYVTLRDLLDEVGRDAVRFTMLTRKSDAQMEFDLDLAVAQTRDNPAFYVQYAHARCRSVLRAAAEQGGWGDTADAALAGAPLDALADPQEFAVMRQIAAWPRLVAGAAASREPHRVAFYLQELAAAFHALWNKGREDAGLRFLHEDRPAETRARLALVAATAVVLRSGLFVLGVSPVEEMR